jgi:hypothetical protein
MVNGAIGRLRFRPTLGSGPLLYGRYSEFTYNFGSNTFDSNAICKISNTGYTSGAIGVSSCSMSGASVTLLI